MFRILVVDDNSNARKLMEAILSKAGYDVLLAVDGQDALDVLDNEHADLILLDVMMPRMDGLEFTRLLRDCGNQTPVLMITAKETKQDKYDGFRAGTDDYLVKPVDEEELLLRISALLRRAGLASERQLVVGSTTLTYDTQSVNWNNAEEQLPPKEFQLLFKLLASPNKVFTRRQLMDDIWSADNDSTERTVDVHINRLRERFSQSQDFEIVTMRGLGYKAVIKEH